jgi:peroxiredoxin
MGNRLSFLALLPFVALIAFTTAIAPGCAPATSRGPSALPTVSSLPSTPLSTLDGTRTDLRAFLKGRPAIISLWATWCDACVTEMSTLNRLHAQASALGNALVVGVAVGEVRESVRNFARGHELAYTQLIDEDFRLADALGERRVPATLIVDRKGRIVFRGGTLDSAGLAAFRQALSRGE